MQNLIRYSLLLSLFTFIGTALEAQSILFEKGDWEAIKAKAAEEDKMIFAEFYTTWCAPCRKMARNVFSDPAISPFYNQHFINYKINAEEAEGRLLKEQYGVGAYPSFVFIRSDGSSVLSGRGYMNAAPFLEMGEKALALKEDKALNKLRKAYKAGRRDKAFLIEFMQLRRERLSADNSSLLKELIDQLSEEELEDPSYITIIADNFCRGESKAFDLMLAQQERIINEELLTLDPAYEEAHQKQKERLEQVPSSQLLEASPELLRQKIIMQDYESRMDIALNNSFGLATRTKDNALFDEIVKKHLQLNQLLKRRRSEQRNAKLKLRYFSITDQDSLYAKVAETYINTYILSQPVTVMKDRDSLRQHMEALYFGDESLAKVLGSKEAKRIEQLRSQSRKLNVRNTARELTEVAGQFYDFFEDEMKLLKAVAWVEEAILRYDEPLHYLTYARLINKLGDRQLAIRLLERGMSIGKGTEGDKVTVSPRVWRKDMKSFDRELKKLKK